MIFFIFFRAANYTYQIIEDLYDLTAPPNKKGSAYLCRL